MKKIFLFNGPPGSGKDTAANMFKDLMGDVYQYKMAYPLKESCHKMLGLVGSLEELEHLKELPIDFIVTDEFIANNENQPKPIKIDYIHGEPKITLRQFYIHVSENVMKPLYGSDIFGRLAVKYISQSRAKFVAISDCGFEPEVAPLLDHYGPSSFTLVKLFRDGKSFANDSRNYISLPGVETFEIQNDKSMEDLDEMLRGITQRILGSSCSELFNEATKVDIGN